MCNQILSEARCDVLLIPAGRMQAGDAVAERVWELRHDITPHDAW
jgi:hypothetical protein